MDSITLIYCGAAFLILIGLFKLGYYLGHKDGLEEGAQMVLNVADELWRNLMQIINTEE